MTACCGQIEKKISHPLFEGMTSDPVYLYSWQERDPIQTEFTVIKEEGELGLKIFYFILDKKGRLLSCTQVAGRGSEGGYWFEARSKFVGPDTILSTGAITQWYDFDKQQKMEKTKGDTTFSCYVIGKSGNVTGKVFKEVKDLHFEDRGLK